ncbi:hypothetical protein K443DRAFT_92295 [Laccaria amethystina LaAM-08-1]|uniref:Uncharacterized protein n=1 Tax=Laccaria amethystina LaAM-08-1 TaxID=1095629 RepID=A0A0C9WYA6_9AGAR|nr:hypothetical protein K443DRAFT_92295 [Laccaria amethystina LaAM-08-1]
MSSVLSNSRVGTIIALKDIPWVLDKHHDSMSFSRPEEVRAIWHNILEISDMLCVRRMMYSIFVSSPLFLMI